MKTQQAVIQNKLGLHARASAKFVGIASSYPCSVQVQHGDLEANGKSMMSLLTLAASQGKSIVITTDGEHEGKALKALVALVESQFGEGE